jgi:hypothetical protein
MRLVFGLAYRALRRSGDVPVVSLSDDEKAAAAAVDVRRAVERQGIDPDTWAAMMASVGDQEEFNVHVRKALEGMGFATPEGPPDASAPPPTPPD